MPEVTSITNFEEQARAVLPTVVHTYYTVPTNSSAGTRRRPPGGCGG